MLGIERILQDDRIFVNIIFLQVKVIILTFILKISLLLKKQNDF